MLILALRKNKDPSELDSTLDELQKRIFTISDVEINGVKGRFFSYSSVYGGVETQWWMKRGPSMLILSLTSRSSRSAAQADFQSAIQSLAYDPEEA